MKFTGNNLLRREPAAARVLAGIVLCLIGALPLAPLAAKDWQVVRHRDRDYVKAADIAAFYRFTKTESGSEIVFSSPTIEMRAATDSDKLAINGISFLLSYPVVRVGGDAVVSRVDLCKLLDPVLRPAQIDDAEDFHTVVIDPGHGGEDSGCPGLATHEKVYTLDLSKKLFQPLILRGFKVRFTRSDDETLTLKERVRRANEVDGAIFVSLHFNAHPSSDPHGIETYAITPPGTRSSGESRPESETWQGNLRDAESIALATAVHASALSQTHAADRGVRRARFHVLKGLKMPGILFEGGYITNPIEGGRIDKDAYRGLLANAIADGIDKFRRALRKRN
jgi:N-acetylmuramoyl-L-alanine amidase